MIFTKPIKDLSFNDVKNFCEQKIRENVNLDYKEDLPSNNNNLAKTIAAFANTYGGVIILGVEDDDGLPKLPVKGIEKEKGLSEKITQIIIDNIYPPVFPEVGIYENDSRDRVLIIIRVHQSNETPHAIRGNTETYIRVNDVRRPEKLATMERIEWLKEKRLKSEKLRNQLIDEAKWRHRAEIPGIIKDRSLTTIINSEIHREIPSGHCCIHTIPLFPLEAFSNPDLLVDILGEVSINDCYSSNLRPFPALIASRKVSANGAVIKEDEKFYTEMNQFGLFYHGEELLYFIDLAKKEIIEKTNRKDFEVGDMIFYFSRLDKFLVRLDQMIELSSKFYERIGYHGLIKINFLIPETNLTILTVDTDYIHELTAWQHKLSLETEFEWEKVITSDDLLENKEEMLKDFCKKIGWCHGWQAEREIENGLIKSYFDRLRR